MAPRGNRFFIGLDVHKACYHVALRCFDGVVHTLVTTAKPQVLIEKFQKEAHGQQPERLANTRTTSQSDSFGAGDGASMDRGTF